MRQTLVSAVLVTAALSFAPNARVQAATPFAPGPPGVAAPTPAPRSSAVSTSPTSTPGADRHAAGSAVPPAPRRSLALRFTLSPEWGYRSFRDKEPNTTDKRYTAAGIPAASARLELYPLAFITPAVDVGKDFGVTAGYSRAIGLKSRDVDTDSEVATQWYQVNVGARYRIHGEDSPIELGFTLGIQNWVYDFEITPPSRPVAIARYTLLPAGVDFRYTWKRLSFFADARFLLPLAVSPMGDRTPSGSRFGFSTALGAAFAVSRIFEIEARGTGTLLSIAVPSVPGRSDPHGTIIDQYVVFSLGATLLY